LQPLLALPLLLTPLLPPLLLTLLLLPLLLTLLLLLRVLVASASSLHTSAARQLTVSTDRECTTSNFRSTLPSAGFVTLLPVKPFGLKVSRHTTFSTGLLPTSPKVTVILPSDEPSLLPLPGPGEEPPTLSPSSKPPQVAVMVAIATAECGGDVLGASSVTIAVPRTCRS
jgi:hypothetical protein